MALHQQLKYFLVGVVSSVFALSISTMAMAHEENESFQVSAIQKERTVEPSLIYSKDVEVSPNEANIGISNIRDIMPALAKINERYRSFSPKDFKYYVENFHYPFRKQFSLEKQKPPTQVVLHWTANKRVDNPLVTLSAFLRRGGNSGPTERPNMYKNVANYLLTGNLKNESGDEQAHLVKLTRGELSSGGDIPRVTAYPTAEAWDDNKYDGRGAIGIEIESPNFGSFYGNPSQREKLYHFVTLVLQERGVLSEFEALRSSPYWEDMKTLHAHLRERVNEIDVNARGGIPDAVQYVDLILKKHPEISPNVYQETKKIFNYISGHGVVAREYNQRMIAARRFADADYDKIDFTEAQVFVVAMDLLTGELGLPNGIRYAQYDEATMALIRGKNSIQEIPILNSTPGINLPLGMLIPPSAALDSTNVAINKEFESNGQ